MILDTLTHRQRYAQIPALHAALEFLHQAVECPPQERVEMQGDQIFANPVSLTSKPVENCVFEAHRKYCDVHFILSGVEGISLAEVEDLSTVEPFQEDRDIGFYQGKPTATVYLHPGEFLLCWPNEAHRVAMMEDAPGEIKKIVVKIAAGSVE